MNLVKKIRMFSLSAAALRAIGLVFAVAGLAGVLIQCWVLGVGSVSNSQLLQTMQADPGLMGSATLALIFQAMEACAVPVFALLLTENARRRESVGGELLRMLGFAAVCQLPYNVLTTGSLLMIRGLNPVFSLVMGLIMLYFFCRFPGKKGSHVAIKTTAIVFAFLWSNLLGIAHGPACVVLTAVLWALRGKQNLQSFLGIAAVICCSVFDLFYLLAPVSFLFLHFYDGEQGADNRRVSCLGYLICLVVFAVLSKVL